MTRERFEEITTYDELEAADSEFGTEVFYEFRIYSDCDLDDYMWNEIINWELGWRDLCAFLNHFPSGYSWYDTEEECGLEDGDDLFCTTKDEIRRRADEEGLFDDDDCEDEVECQQEIREINVIIEDFSMSDFL